MLRVCGYDFCDRYGQTVARGGPEVHSHHVYFAARGSVYASSVLLFEGCGE